MKSLADKQNLFIAVLILIVLTTVVYWPVLGHDFIDYDDPDYVSHNEVVQHGLTSEGLKWAFTTGHASNWHPLTWVSHMLDAQWFGLKPAGHHGTNLFFHIANSILLLLLLFQMTDAVWRSALVAALFALHPLHVESVAWVAERKDVLSTFFGLLCLMAYARYARASARNPIDTSPGVIDDSVRRTSSGLRPPSPQSGEGTLPDRGGEGAHRQAWIWYGVAFLLLALGLMSKPMLVTWPFVMLLLDVWPLRRIDLSTLDLRPSTLRPLVMEKLPFLALVVGSCVVTFLVQQGGGAVTTMENLPIEDRLGNAIVSYAKYLFMTVWPTNLAIFYPHPELTYPASTQWPSWAIGLTLLFLLVVSSLVIRRRTEQPFLVTGWFWYLGTLVPVIGLVQVGTQALADRYTYVPLIGIFIVLSWGANTLLQRLRIPSSTYPVVGAVVVIACALLSSQQVKVWQNDFSLFGHALKVTTGNAPAHSTLGKAWAKKGDFEKALEHLRAAKEAYPHYPNVDYDTGLTLFYLGRYQEAIDEYLAELARNPDHWMARHNLATAYRSMGKSQEAIEQYQLVLQAKPDYIQSLYGLGSALASVGRTAEAETYLRRTLEIDPGFESAKTDLARVLASTERYDEAERILTQIADLDAKPQIQVVRGNILMESGRTNDAATVFREISARFPELAEAYLNDGKRQLASGNSQAALGDFVTALRLAPTLAEAHLSAGLVLAQSGKVEAATSFFETAATLKQDASVYYHLAVAYGAQSRYRDAVGAYQKAIELEPQAVAALNNLAWLFATNPDASLRNGQKAVEYAERACKVSDNKQPVFLGTLAAAYAESGRFDDAIRTGEQARELAERSGLKDLATRNAELVEQYRAGKPYRDPTTP